ncbi:hypothetical protein [Neorhodopirellula pilleata]|uniref:NHL repeat protein n=1 Tax=Neorhodopirellula pilleata TaxID=2714738 RepID=A0A5C6AQ36_9BACT|nr:hypothetical protein [Neorhodopirellula pilleata]TWU01648.1 NHL repeat protein [Neorhodopirellula pilleata]
MKINSILWRVVTLLFASTGMSYADELAFCGVLGNSGEHGKSLVSFRGPPSAGMGPVLDDDMTLWERGGAMQLNRYKLDGRLVASYPLPESSDRNDQMTRVGNTLLMNIRKTLYSLAIDAPAGSHPERRISDVEVMSSSSFGGRVVLYEKNRDQLVWYDATSGERTNIAQPGFHVVALEVDDTGTVFAFGGGEVHAWRDAQPVIGFPKDFHGERPQKIGRYWYTHGWHGTIHRMNDRFEPSPGVVMGGASGSFIGYLPQSVDITNGRGLVHVRDDLFAVSGLDGVVQILRWNDQQQRFESARRLGALANLTGVAIDSSGNIWTPRGSWRWNDSCEAPHTLGDKQPDVHAQPVILNGQSLCLLKKHYQYVQLAHGACVDANGWSHLETDGIQGFELAESVTGAAAISKDNGLSLVVVQRNGNALEIGITEDGRLRSTPKNVAIEDLNNCTSLAWLDSRLYAADDGEVVAYERADESSWKVVSRVAKYDGETYIHSDGARLVVSDSAGGAVRVFDSSLSEVAKFVDLETPTHVAISGDRLVVYEAGRQRLLKLELAQRTDDALMPSVKQFTSLESQHQHHLETDFQDFGRPGGIPLAVAVTPSADGLEVSIRTRSQPNSKVQLGTANDDQAFLLTGAKTNSNDGQFDFHLPAGDWSRFRLAVAVTFPEQQERFGFLDHRAIHAPFSNDPADWAPFDWQSYREQVDATRQQIRITFDQPTEGKTTLVIENEAGERVRNLVSGRSFTAGKHTVIWDGLDERQRLVAPGRYHWRGITHPGIEPVYKMCFANGDESTVAAWGPNHSTLHHVAANDHLVFFAAPVTEGGWALLALDTEGRFVQGYDHLHGYGIQHNAIAVDDQYLYCAQDGFTWGGTKDVDLGSDTWTATWKLTIVRYDIESGKLVEFPGKRRAVEVDEMLVGPGSNHTDLDEFNLAGLAIRDGKLYLGSRDEQAVIVLDAETGERLDSIAMPGVRHLASGNEVYAATDRSVVRLRDQRQVIDAAAMDLAGITIAPNGDILISDTNSHQIHRYTTDGKRVDTIGTPGGPYKGAYDPTRMVNPAGLVFGPGGKLWVTEKRWNPKRVLAWDIDQKKVVFEKFGMPHYGGDGSGFDPENPRRWIGLGCFWDVDIERGTARPTHILSKEEGHFGKYHPHSYLFFREAGRTFLCARGKIALISEVLPNGTLHDLAAIAGTHHFAYGCQWEPPKEYIDAFYAKWPDKRAREKPGRKGEGKPWSQRGMGVVWVDRNGDGKTQQEEFDFCGDDLEFAGGAWGHLQTSLTLTLPVVEKDQVKIVSLRPNGLLANGVPDYPTLNEAITQAQPIDMTPGYKRSGVATVVDRFGRLIFNSDPEINAYPTENLSTDIPTRQSFSSLWTYPNQWSDVHGSHNAPLPEPGVMQGTLGILGRASLDEQSDVIFFNGNHGRCFLMSTDGLYLDETFVDVRVSYQRNEYRLGGEIFGGSFGRSATDGTYYVQIGHGPYRIYELSGLNQARRISGTIDVRKEQILMAQQQNLRRVEEQQPAKKVNIPGTVRWDKSGKFPVEIELNSDATHLHLRYRVQDRSPWINNGRDWTKLFATGDSVDLQIGTNPQASPKRIGPVEGDKRLLLAPFEGRVIAVLYEHRKPGGKNPIEFTSPWRGETVDHVQQLSGVTITIDTHSAGYEVNASVPLSDLGLNVSNDSTYRADFGVTYGDAEGTDTNLRSYWSNQSTGLVDDIPGEIMLSPNLWGDLRFAVPSVK